MTLDLALCELSQIMISENQESQMIVLRELEAPNRSLPIAIGLNEAMAINRTVSGVEILRPMTHDLLVHVMEGLGGHVRHVIVSDLVEDKQGYGTFYGILVVEQDGKVLTIDSRPSDAIALAVRTGAQIYVATSVLEKAGLSDADDSAS